MPNEKQRGPDDFPCGCLVTSAPEGQIGRALVYANAYFERLLGMHRDELVGRNLTAVLSRASSIMFDSYMLPMLLHEGECEEVMLDFIDGSGSVVPVVANAILDKDGKGGIYWSVFNATKRNQLDQELVDARRKLEEYSEKLYRLAITDELTGLVNRRELKRRAEALVAQARRTNLPVSVVVLDIDHFKLINDSQGHIAGDDILKRLSQVLADHARESDVIGRYGGEEFSFVLPDTNEENALIFTRRLHELVAEIRVDNRPLTISVGVVSTERFSEGADSYEKLFELADRAMYRAKAAGRNQTELACR